jgi:hypothetical protein
MSALARDVDFCEIPESRGRTIECAVGGAVSKIRNEYEITLLEAGLVKGRFFTENPEKYGPTAFRTYQIVEEIHDGSPLLEKHWYELANQFGSFVGFTASPFSTCFRGLRNLIVGGPRVGGSPREADVVFRLSSDKFNELKLFTVKSVEARQQPINEFRPSKELVEQVVLSRKRLVDERLRVLDMLRKDLSSTDFSEAENLLSYAANSNVELQDDVDNFIEEQVRALIETIGRVSLKGARGKFFFLTLESGSKFLPWVENALLSPFNLTAEFMVPFLEYLLRDIKPVAASGTFRTAHARLVIHDKELVVERLERKAATIFGKVNRKQRVG